MNINDPIKRGALRLIGAASCLGARDRHCDTGPDTLRALQVETVLGKDAAWKEILRPDVTPDDPNATVHAVSDLCRRLSQSIRETLQSGARFTVYGGDHSVAVGTWNGAAASLQGPLGLIWIDAHMDAHTPATSPSGALHGMPVACLMGYGDPHLCGVGALPLRLRPENVCLIGVRSFESGEQALLQRLGVRIFYMPEVQARGLDAVFADALERVTKHTAGYGISIDLDAIDPADAPGVGSPEPGGIRALALLDTLAGARLDERLVGAEITELNPDNDVDDKTARLVGALTAAIFS